MCVSHSVMSDSVTLRIVTHQASLSMGFSRQEYWSVLPFPSPEDLSNPGTEPRSPALQADSLPFELQGSPSLENDSDSNHLSFILKADSEISTRSLWDINHECDSPRGHP